MYEGLFGLKSDIKDGGVMNGGTGGEDLISKIWPIWVTLSL